MQTIEKQREKHNGFMLALNAVAEILERQVIKNLTSDREAREVLPKISQAMVAILHSRNILQQINVEKLTELRNKDLN